MAEAPTGNFNAVLALPARTRTPTAGREFPDVAFALPDVDLDMRKVDISTLLSRNQALSAISESPFFF